MAILLHNNNDNNKQLARNYRVTLRSKLVQQASQSVSLVDNHDFQRQEDLHNQTEPEQN